MNNQEIFIYEIFHKQLFWLDGWFQEGKRAIVPLTDQDQETIFDELSKNWKQADIIALLNALAEQFGREKVVEVVEMVVAENTRREWAEVAHKKKSNTIDDLIQILWDPSQFDFTMEQRDGGVQMHITRCPYVELAKEFGATDWFYHLCCIGDPPLVEGFNPKMGFRRTKTLMEGHECCDHFYFLKD